MFNNTQPHTFFNEGKVVSRSGAVVLYRTSIQEDPSLAIKKFIGAGLMTLFLGVLTLQAGWVYNASAEEGPISSPVTAQQTPTATPTSSSSGSSSSSQSQTQSQNNNNQPITAPETPSPSPSASSPITSPEVTPSPSSNPSSNPSSGGSNGGGNNGGGSSSSSGGSVGAPSCNNEAPKSAPKILSALTTGKNEITLTWEKAKDPVTQYVIAYGLEKGKPLYGNPNVGNVTSSIVKGLSGGFTYYFKVRAGNDCQPGAYSEEIGVKVGGKFINAPAQGFKTGVLGKTIKKNIAIASANPMPQASIKPQAQTNSGLFGKVFNFFKGFFN